MRLPLYLPKIGCKSAYLQRFRAYLGPIYDYLPLQGAYCVSYLEMQVIWVEVCIIRPISCEIAPSVPESR